MFDNIEVEVLRRQMIQDGAVDSMLRFGDGLREQMAGSVGMEYVENNGDYDENGDYVAAWLAGDIVASAPM